MQPHHEKLVFTGGPLDGLGVLFDGEKIILVDEVEALAEHSGIKVLEGGEVSVILYRRSVGKLLRYMQQNIDDSRLFYDRQWDSLEDFRADMEAEK